MSEIVRPFADYLRPTQLVRLRSKFGENRERFFRNNYNLRAMEPAIENKVAEVHGNRTHRARLPPSATGLEDRLQIMIVVGATGSGFTVTCPAPSAARKSADFARNCPFFHRDRHKSGTEFSRLNRKIGQKMGSEGEFQAAHGLIFWIFVPRARSATSVSCAA